MFEQAAVDVDSVALDTVNLFVTGVGSGAGPGVGFTASLQLVQSG